MRQTKITAFLALAFILGVGAPIVGIAALNDAAATEVADASSAESGDAATIAEQSATTEVNTEAALRDAIADGATSVTLTGNINLTSALKIERTTPLAINLNGYKITASASVNNAIIVMQGNVHFIGTGSIEVSATALTLEGSNNPAAANYTVVTVDAGVILKSNTMYGATVDVYHAHSGDKELVSYGVILNFNGQIVAPYGISINGNVQHSSNAPVVNIGNGAVINAASATEADATPIYAAGTGTWNVGAATLSGHAAVATKSGKLTFNGTAIDIDGTMTTAPQPSANGINGYSSVFQVEHNVKYADAVEITVNGGNYTSAHGDVFYEYNLTSDNQAAADIDINGGTFAAAAGKPVFGGDVVDMNIQISGGTFSGSDVASFKEQGYLVGSLDIDENGVVIAPSQPSTGGSTSATTTQLTSADGAVTVTGNLKNAVTLKAEPVEKKFAAFGKYKTAAYDLHLLDAKGKEVQLTEPVAVSIEVPAVIDGAKSRIYYLDEAEKAEQLESYYVGGKINFSATHFSLYAIVENSASVLTGSDVLDQQVPNTGAISKQGIITAISTTVPLMILAGVAFIWFNRHMVKVRRAERLAEEERERIAKAYIPKAKREATIDRFVATPMEQHNPDGPMVDMFINSAK